MPTDLVKARALYAQALAFGDPLNDAFIEPTMFMAVLLHLSMNASGTITGMMFPETSSEQKLDLYEYYVVSLWTVVCLGALVRRFARAREINGAAQRSPS